VATGAFGASWPATKKGPADRTERADGGINRVGHHNLDRHMRIIFVRPAIIAAAFCALAWAAPASAAANLLVDGDFETPATPTGGFVVFNGGQDAGGWTVLGPTRGGAVQLLSDTYAEPNIAFDAESGTASMDLSGPGNVGGTAGVAQTVDTVAGQVYRLDFWVGNADGSHNANYALPSTVDLQIGDGPAQAFTNAATTFERTDWRHFETSFVGTGAPTEIAFFNGTAHADAETGLDNVSLTLAVPEPATWWLMILGFGLIGAALRRGRANPAQPRSIRAR
jgi:hypothetical protein